MATNLLRTKSRRRAEKIDWVEFFASIVATFVGGWVTMLTVGIVHHEWLPEVPTLGYWPSLLIFYMVDWIVMLMRWHARTVPVRSDSSMIYPKEDK